MPIPTTSPLIEGIIEQLAELEHEQWIAWSKNIAKTEPSLNCARLARWQNLWKPYSKLTEEEKDQDRIWAKKILPIINKVEQSTIERCLKCEPITDEYLKYEPGERSRRIFVDAFNFSKEKFISAIKKEFNK